jgi:hypothetical protein
MSIWCRIQSAHSFHNLQFQLDVINYVSTKFLGVIPSLSYDFSLSLKIDYTWLIVISNNVKLFLIIARVQYCIDLNKPFCIRYCCTMNIPSPLHPRSLFFSLTRLIFYVAVISFITRFKYVLPGEKLNLRKNVTDVIIFPGLR